MLYIVKTVVGKEKDAAESIMSRIKKQGYIVGSILLPDKMRGYIIIEGDEAEIKNAISGLHYVKNVIGEVKSSEIKKYLDAKKIVVEINKGDIVEISSGPFKGEKARVTSVNQTKNEVTLDLLEAAVSMPLTVKTNTIIVLKQDEI